MGVRKHGKFICKVVVFLCLLGVMVYGVNRTLVKKYLYNENAVVTAAQYGFYEMERNSVDVLFLGSSHTRSAFNPQDLYDEYHIRSYNLGSDSQALWMSYYWLKEALRYQSPQVAVLDCYMLWSDRKTDEGMARQALDSMRLGSVKLEAIDTVYIYDERQSWLSYLFPNIRFHERWAELRETDFIWYGKIAVPSKDKGFTVGGRNQCGYEDYVPLEISGSGSENFIPEAEIYLDKIVRLCGENNIRLILVKTPTSHETERRHNAVAEYADANDLEFYDFNEKSLYEMIDFDYPEDMDDTSTTRIMDAHANRSGAKKMTHFLGGILVNNYGVTQTQDWQWEETREFNEHMWKNFLLHNETDPGKYLSMLKDDSYTVFITVKDEASGSLNESLQEALLNLGLTADWSDAYQKSYYAVIEKGQVAAEEMAGKKLEHKGSFRDGEMIYSLVSAGLNCGNDCSIKINNSEQAKRERGLNIVVYDNELKCVIDSVCFDTYAEELTAIR